MKKEVDQRTHERIRRLMDSIKRQTHFAVTYEIDDKIEELENKLFNLCLGYDEARIYLKGYPRLIKRLNEQSDSNSKDNQSNNEQSVFPYPKARWENFIIFELNDTKVKIRNLLNEMETVFSYVDLNMVDNRTKQPNVMWDFQKILISYNGFLPLSEIKERDKTKHTAARYNKHLKELFRINENIYPHAKTEGGYRLRIQTRKAYKSST